MATRKMTGKRCSVTASSGNVYRDLGFPDAGTELAKAELAHRVVSVIEELGLTQREAAQVLGTDQPGISQLVCGNLKRFSMDRLFRFLNALGRDVEIVVKRKPRSRPHASVRVALDRKKSRRSA